MKNLKKTSGVVRLNDTVGVTKKCSEDWKVRIQNLAASATPQPRVFLVAHSVMGNWFISTSHKFARHRTLSGLHITFVGKKGVLTQHRKT